MGQYKYAKETRKTKNVESKLTSTHKLYKWKSDSCTVGTCTCKLDTTSTEFRKNEKETNGH